MDGALRRSASSSRLTSVIPASSSSSTTTIASVPSTTFASRLRHFAAICDPRLLAPSLFFGMSLQEAMRLHDTSRSSDVADRIVASALHPETGESIPVPFRMGGFAVCSTPIMVGVLVSRSATWTVGFQVANQAYNAAFNFCNRSTGTALPVAEIAASSGIAAITSSVAILAARRAASRWVSAAMQRFVPFPAVALGSVSNMLIMRRRELEEGVLVRDAHDGRALGSSVAAARIAMAETGLSRAALAACNLAVPPLCMLALERSACFRARPGLHLPVQAACCMAAFMAGVPLSTALFDQDRVVPASALEADILRAAGAAEASVVFNRGV